MDILQPATYLSPYLGTPALVGLWKALLTEGVFSSWVPVSCRLYLGCLVSVYSVRSVLDSTRSMAAMPPRHKVTLC